MPRFLFTHDVLKQDTMTIRLPNSLQGLKWGAILLGVVADQVGTIVAFFLLTIAGAFRQALIRADLSPTEAATPSQQVQFFVVGALLTFLGGFVTARWRVRPKSQTRRSGVSAPLCAAAL
jgi:hypothetical protein